MSRAITAAFLGSVAIITWREIKNPSPDQTLPIPLPSRYVGAGVAFGMLAILGDIVNQKVADVLAVGLLFGLAFQTAQTQIANAGQSSVFTGDSSGTPTNPSNLFQGR